jgi:sensor histidine kinase YesM
LQGTLIPRANSLGEKRKVTTYSSIKNSAQSARSNSSDQELKKLANAVYELTRKVRNLEDEVERLKSQLR